MISIIVSTNGNIILAGRFGSNQSLKFVGAADSNVSLLLLTIAYAHRRQ